MPKSAHGLARCSRGEGGREVSAPKPDDLSSIPGTHSGRKEPTPRVVFRPHLNTQNNNKNNHKNCSLWNCSSAGQEQLGGTGLLTPCPGCVPGTKPPTTRLRGSSMQQGGEWRDKPSPSFPLSFLPSWSTMTTCHDTLFCVCLSGFFSCSNCLRTTLLLLLCCPGEVQAP